MPNIRMFALAGALLLLIPVGVLAGPQSDVYQAEAEVEAQVSNIHLLEPQVNGSPINVGVMPEQVVEGHTTFVTIEARVNATKVEGNVTVDGFVNCEYHGEATTSGKLLGLLPYVTGVKDVNVHCHVGDRVIITPTLYCQVMGNFQCGSSTAHFPLLTPTGNVYPFTSPTGQAAYIEEYQFERTMDDGYGGLMTTTYYAWATPILTPWLDEHGHAQNMMLPMPGDRLDAMPDVDHFSALYEDKVRKDS